MRRAACIGASALVGAILGCEGEPPPGLDIDFGGVCHALDLVEVQAPLVGGEEVLALAAESADDGWALVRPGDGGDLVLRRSADPSIVVDLAIPPNEAAAVALFRGANAGESWLTYATADRFRVALLDETSIVRAGNLDNFPGDTFWERRVLIAGRQPLVLASPLSSNDASVVFYLATLAPDLSIGQSWQLSFDAECYTDGISDCLPTTYPRLHILDVAEVDADGPALLLLEFERAFESVASHTTGVATLELSLDEASNTPIAVKREYIDLLWGHSLTKLHVDPGQIARDSSGFYVIAGVVVDEVMEGGDPGLTAEARLLRNDTRESTSALLRRLPTYTNSHLIQLDDQAALGQAFDGQWYAARLVGYAIDEENTAAMDIANDVVVRRAGHHNVLLQSKGGPDAHAAVRCAAEAP